MLIQTVITNESQLQNSIKYANSSVITQTLRASLMCLYMEFDGNTESRIMLTLKSISRPEWNMRHDQREKNLTKETADNSLPLLIADMWC